MTKRITDPDRFQMKDLKRRVAQVESRQIRNAGKIKQLRDAVRAIKDAISDAHQEDSEDPGSKWG